MTHSAALTEHPKTATPATPKMQSDALLERLQWR